MNRIFWDAIFLITGSFLTHGTGQENSTIPASTPGTTATTTASTFTTISTTTTTIPTTTTTTTSTTTTTTTTTTSTTTATIPVKKLVAAAVRSHFDDCPDSHSHFCFHGSCRFLILEETPACVCHPGFMGMRCEHADLLAVVATNHRQQTAATVLVLCVIGCVLTMLLCSLIHCWWQSDRHRRRHAHHCAAEKPGSAPPGRGPCCPHSESVV